MARQFVRLHQTLRRNGELSAADQEIWTFIGTQINYARYCEDSAAPVVCQGVLKSQKNGQAVVEWLDQSQTPVSGVFADRLRLVNIGESFTCKAKFINRKLVELSQVEPLFLPEVADISWIQPFLPTA
jgi:hypothetical protein